MRKAIQKSAVVGEMERAVGAQCEMLELNGKLRLTTNLSPDAAMATAGVIRMLAQMIDLDEARLDLHRKLRLELLKIGVGVAVVATAWVVVWIY